MREAIPILRRTAREFGELEMVWESGMVLLQLAEALLAANEPQEVPAICSEVVSSFTRIGVNARATTALTYLREAAALGRTTPQLVREARASLHRVPTVQPQLFAAGWGKG